MERICVFCGASPGTKARYTDAARELGEELVRRGIGLVYGGGNIGLMGTLARTVIGCGGEVIGVIPQKLARKEVAFLELADLRVVGSMHERQSLMAELAEGFIALPGGLGTIEEILEMLAWAQLGLHAKPCGIMNVCGYYDFVIDFLNHAVDEGFVDAGHLSTMLVEKHAARMLDRLAAYQTRPVDKIAWAVRMSRSSV